MGGERRQLKSLRAGPKANWELLPHVDEVENEVLGSGDEVHSCKVSAKPSKNRSVTGTSQFLQAHRGKVKAQETKMRSRSQQEMYARLKRRGRKAFGTNRDGGWCWRAGPLFFFSLENPRGARRQGKGGCQVEAKLND